MRARAHILVVDDEVIVGQGIRRNLERLGYHVSAVAISGQEAIQRAGDLRPDLVLMDIRLSGEMDGVEAAARIREGLNVPVVYLTAMVDEETLRRAKVTKPYGYLLKPFELEDLGNTIELSLYQHEVERRARG